jgi:hypothetical protein
MDIYSERTAMKFMVMHYSFILVLVVSYAFNTPLPSVIVEVRTFVLVTTYYTNYLYCTET